MNSVSTVMNFSADSLSHSAVSAAVSEMIVMGRAIHAKAAARRVGDESATRPRQPPAMRQSGRAVALASRDADDPSGTEACLYPLGIVGIRRCYVHEPACEPEVAGRRRRLQTDAAGMISRIADVKRIRVAIWPCRCLTACGLTLCEFTGAHGATVGVLPRRCVGAFVSSTAHQREQSKRRQ